MKEIPESSITIDFGNSVFPKTRQDEKPSPSRDDREFLQIMEKELKVKESSNQGRQLEEFGINVLQTTIDNEKLGISIKEKEFLNIIENQFIRDKNGCWSAPLPFKLSIPLLPNNRSMWGGPFNQLIKNHNVTPRWGIYRQGFIICSTNSLNSGRNDCVPKYKSVLDIA